MRKHNGMRPLDIVVLLKIIALDNEPWLQKDIAQALLVSNSEVSESLNRSQVADLLDDTKQRPMRQNLLDFLCHGLRFVFPAQPGGLVRGIPTAHSAPMLAGRFVSQLTYVWADSSGSVLGHEIEPLYSTVPQACQSDARLYELLALVDMLRVGRAREVQLATQQLTDQILHPVNA